MDLKLTSSFGFHLQSTPTCLGKKAMLLLLLLLDFIPFSQAILFYIIAISKFQLFIDTRALGDALSQLLVPFYLINLTKFCQNNFLLLFFNYRPIVIKKMLQEYFRSLDASISIIILTNSSTYSCYMHVLEIEVLKCSQRTMHILF